MKNSVKLQIERYEKCGMYVYEIKDTSLIAKMKRRMNLIEAVCKEHQCNGYHCEGADLLPLPTQLFYVKKPSTSVKKIEGYIYSIILPNSDLEKRLKNADIVIKEQEVLKAIGVPTTKEVHQITYFAGRYFVATQYKKDGCFNITKLIEMQRRAIATDKNYHIF